MRLTEIDAEHECEHIRKVGMHSKPTTLLLNSQGCEITRAVGAPRKAQVIASVEALG